MYSTWGNCRAYRSHRAIELSFKSPSVNNSPHQPHLSQLLVPVSNEHLPTLSQSLPPGAQSQIRGRWPHSSMVREHRAL